MDWWKDFEEAGRCENRYLCPALDRLADAIHQPGHDEVAWTALGIMESPESRPDLGPGRFAAWAVEQWIRARHEEGVLDQARGTRAMGALLRVCATSSAFRTRSYHLSARHPTQVLPGAPEFLQSEAESDERTREERVAAAVTLGAILTDIELFERWITSADEALQHLATAMLMELDYRLMGGPAHTKELLRLRAAALPAIAAHTALRWLQVIGRRGDEDVVLAFSAHPDQGVARKAAALAANLRD